MLSRLLVLALLLLTAPARAQDLRATARQHFDDARREFDQGHFQRALELFKQSYGLAPHPDMLFNIGRCYEQLRLYREALDAYQRYLAVNPGDNEAKSRALEMELHVDEEPWPPPAPLPSPSPEPLVASLAPAPAARPTPVYKKWWLWTAVAAVAGVALGVGLGVGLSQPNPDRSFPPLSGR